jgi:putative transcriptional regulator
MKEAFESIKQGLSEAIEYAKGKSTKAIIHSFNAADVKKIRANMGMSQREFASVFGISLGTLRHWERGDRKPQGPALVLLNIVAKEPKVVLKALSS